MPPVYTHGYFFIIFPVCFSGLHNKTGYIVAFVVVADNPFSNWKTEGILWAN